MLSGAVHGALFLSGKRFVEQKRKEKPIQINTVKILQPTPIPTPVVPAVPTAKPTPVVEKKKPKPKPVVKKKKPKKVKKKVYKNIKRKKKLSKKVKKPRIRQTKKAPPKKKQVKKKITPVAGISQSTRKDDKASSIAAAVGNTSEVAVDPNQKALTEEEVSLSETPPPKVVNYEEVSVDALAVDELATCEIPEVELTDDALDEGLETGVVEVMVIIDEKGEIKKAKLIKKTGFQIDNIILAKAKSLKCKPAKVNGKPVPVKNKKLQWVIQS